MTTWVYLLIYLLLVINLPPLKLFDAEKAVFRTASVINTDLKSSHTQKKTFFSLKKVKSKKKRISTLPSRHTKFEGASISVQCFHVIWTLIGRRRSQWFDWQFYLIK